MTTNYSSQDISSYGYFFSLLSIFSIIISFRLENLIFQVRLGIFSKVYINSVIVISSLIFVLIFLFTYLSNVDVIIIYSIFGGWGFSLFNILTNYLVRISKVELLANIRIVRSLIELGLVYYIVHLNYTINIIMLASSFSYFIVSIYIYIVSRAYIKVRLRYISYLVLEYRRMLKYIKYDFPSSLLSSSVVYLPQIIFNNSGNYLISSIYFISSRYFGSPLLLIAQAIGLGLKQEYQKNMDGFIDNSSINIIIGTFFGRKLIYVFFFSFLIIPVIYIIHNDYDVQDFFLCFIILIPLYWARFIFNCFAGIVYIKAMFRENFVYQLLSNIVVLSVLYTMDLTYITLSLYSILSMIMYILFSVYIIKGKK
ncbi:hypothetical protein [Photobacterium damselae]|uniref:hypothetical protein n=1 Tax=Photobacterium damselae TaxID=38293 RepID=UPI00406858B3